MIGDNWYPKGSLQEPFIPQDISDVQQAFPASIGNLLPPVENIPEEFKRGRTKWNDVFGEWFYGGLPDAQFYPVDGIDPKKAVTHIKTIMGSYDPKHEYKEASVAYLLSLWFTKITWKGGSSG